MVLCQLQLNNILTFSAKMDVPRLQAPMSRDLDNTFASITSLQQLQGRFPQSPYQQSRPVSRVPMEQEDMSSESQALHNITG